MVQFCGLCGERKDSPFLDRWCGYPEPDGTMSYGQGHLWNPPVEVMEVREREPQQDSRRRRSGEV